ncbi:MAG: S1C family serine protease [Dethiobacteria bacterium]|jgi:serine protease Do
MEAFYNGFAGDGREKRLIFWKGTVLGAIIGSLLLAAVFFYLVGMFYPDGSDSHGRIAPVPGEDREDGNRNNTGEKQEYYWAVVKAAEEVTPSVVGISNYGIVFDFWGRSTLQERATGSGVIIGEDGYIVTNNHVIENAKELVVTLGSGDEVPATVIGVDPPTDLAVIKIDKKELPAVSFADSNQLRVGEPAIAIGNPLGLDFQQSVTLGVVSARERSITIQGQKFTFVQTDAAINDGNSGGALVNIHGKVIGINTAKIKIAGVEGMGFAIPSNTVKQITSDLIEKGRVIRPWMGVYIQNVTPLDAKRFEYPVNYGVLITEIVKDGPAYKAGLQPQDIIIAVKGTKIKDTSALQHTLYQFNVGDEVAVTVMRGNEELTIKVILEKLPEQLD